jgi:hypothetical protein
MQTEQKRDYFTFDEYKELVAAAEMNRPGF